MLPSFIISTCSSTIYLVRYILLFICKPDSSRIDVCDFEEKALERGWARLRLLPLDMRLGWPDLFELI